MSGDKRARQGKQIPKTDYHFRLQNANYDWLCEKSKQYGVSVAKVLNAILRRKPEPDEFFLK